MLSTMLSLLLSMQSFQVVCVIIIIIVCVIIIHFHRSWRCCYYINISRALAFQRINRLISSSFCHLRRQVSICGWSRSTSVVRYRASLFSSRICHKSHLDYCNSVLTGVPTKCLRHIQRVQNAAARLILGCEQWDHTTPAPRDLHRLYTREVQSAIQVLSADAFCNYMTSSIPMQHCSLCFYFNRLSTLLSHLLLSQNPHQTRGASLLHFWSHSSISIPLH